MVVAADPRVDSATSGRWNVVFLAIVERAPRLTAIPAGHPQLLPGAQATTARPTPRTRRTERGIYSTPLRSTRWRQDTSRSLSVQRAMLVIRNVGEGTSARAAAATSISASGGTRPITACGVAW